MLLKLLAESMFLFDRGDDRLTLTTCHPKYSAKERLIVSGILTKIEAIS